ncbi:hypothetical protein Peur_065385 [Populus x canadensis]
MSLELRASCFFVFSSLVEVYGCGFLLLHFPCAGKPSQTLVHGRWCLCFFLMCFFVTLWYLSFVSLCCFPYYFYFSSHAFLLMSIQRLKLAQF